MAVPTWVTGQVVTASDVNSWFVPTVAYKTADTARTSTTSITSDPDLVVALAASAFYQIQGMLFYIGSATANQGLTGEWNVPASATMIHQAILQNVGGTATGGSAFNAGTTFTGESTGVAQFRSITINGTIFTSSTSGNVTFQWGPNVNEATAVTLKAQSYIMVTRIG